MLHTRMSIEENICEEFTKVTSTINTNGVLNAEVKKPCAYMHRNILN